MMFAWTMTGEEIFTLIIIPVATGLVTSLLTVIIIELLRTWRLKRQYGRLAGEYEQVVSGNDEPNGQDTTITYEGGTVLKTKNKPSAGKKLQESELWEGRIVLQEGNPYYGQGVFRYPKKNNYGLHQIQVDHETGDIYVAYASAADPATYPAGSIKWRRKTR